MNLLAHCTPISLVQHFTSRNYNTVGVTVKHTTSRLIVAATFKQIFFNVSLWITCPFINKQL